VYKDHPGVMGGISSNSNRFGPPVAGGTLKRKAKIFCFVGFVVVGLGWVVGGVGVGCGFVFFLSFFFAEGGEERRPFTSQQTKDKKIPLSTSVTMKPRLGPEFLLPASTSNSSALLMAAPAGDSADQATAALEEVFKQTMPREWVATNRVMSFQNKKA